MGRLDGRVVIVTGAAHGERAALGATFAKTLAAEGAKVVAADVRDCGSVVREIEAAGGEAVALALDVKREDSIAAMVDAVMTRWGRIDGLVNNAGIGSNMKPVKVTEMTAADWDEIYAVNVRGPFLCTKHVVPVMQKARYGKIVNIGSTTAMMGLPNRLHYVSAKGAIHAMTRSLSRELGADGIRVNTIAYGLITSPATQHELDDNPEVRARVMGPRAMQVHLFPQDVAGGVVFLASAESDKMTGQLLILDPGSVHG